MALSILRPEICQEMAIFSYSKYVIIGSFFWIHSHPVEYCLSLHPLSLDIVSHTHITFYPDVNRRRLKVTTHFYPATSLGIPEVTYSKEQ